MATPKLLFRSKPLGPASTDGLGRNAYYPYRAFLSPNGGGIGVPGMVKGKGVFTASGADADPEQALFVAWTNAEAAAASAYDATYGAGASDNLALVIVIDTHLILIEGLVRAVIVWTFSIGDLSGSDTPGQFPT